eukprot:TRINITY_DN773222_c0_g1_i1.p1 TRINITY_DN773222_c0_g1~~TRINITY_DN773222_c0_g1_i1.p1  ORF type:complete len:255 (-),score=44.58 TRINITY_DN773222_c0_g1_i1:143-907(-)
MKRFKKAAKMTITMSKASKAFQKAKNLDMPTFLGSKVPLELRLAIPGMYELNSESFRFVLSNVINHCKGNEISDESFIEMQRMSKYSEKVFCSLHLILKTAIRQQTKTNEVREHLSAINMPMHCVEDISNSLKANRINIEKNFAAESMQFPTLVDCRWRVDVGISSSKAKSLLKPTVLMEMQDSNGESRTFEVTLEQLQQLRYTVAKGLQEMKRLDQLPICRIMDDIERTRVRDATAEADSVSPDTSSSSSSSV